MGEKTRKDDFQKNKLKKAEEKIFLELFDKEKTFITKQLIDIQKARGVEYDDNQEEEELDTEGRNMFQVAPSRLFPAKKGNAGARTVEELQAKLLELKGKQKLPYKDKLLKKGLINKLKKKAKKDERNLRKKSNMSGNMSKQNLDDDQKMIKPPKPVYNSDGKMVFSKLDFSDLGNNQEAPKTIKDPLVALKKLKKQQQKMREMEESGEKEKVEEIKSRTAWRNAILKAEGAKVKDDPELLKKTIKKTKDRKKKSADKWKARQEKVQKGKDERQKKRTDNIQARSKQKKMTKIKKAVKRGRVVAGF